MARSNATSLWLVLLVMIAPSPGRVPASVKYTGAINSDSERRAFAPIYVLNRMREEDGKDGLRVLEGLSEEEANRPGSFESLLEVGPDGAIETGSKVD